jgi:hypothetical protein
MRNSHRPVMDARLLSKSGGYFPAPLVFPHLLDLHFNTMSLPTLTREELKLHLYAALVQKDLEAYHASVSRDGTNFNWKHIFEDHLVCLYSSNSLYNLIFYYFRSEP